MRRFWNAAAALGVLAGLAAAANPAVSAAGAAAVAIESAKWGPVFPDQPNGPAMSVLWGDVKKGPVGFLLKFQAGAVVPNHVHSSDYRAVVISGEFSHAAERTRRWRCPGFVLVAAARLPHVNTCSAAGLRV
jgi:quercetin dioxygenase-like cupin family protein